MRTGTIAFLLGILLVTQLPVLPETPILLLLFPAILLCLFRYPYLRLFSFFIMGFLWAVIRAQIILTDHLEKDIEGQTVFAVGRVISVPALNKDRTKFDFNINKLTDSEGNSRINPGKVRLNWYHYDVTVTPGQIWQLSIRLKRPHGFMNPGGFDYEGWLFQHRIRATGYVINSPDNRYTGKTRGQYINRIRYFLRHEIRSYFGENSYAGLVIALGIGDRSYITPDQRNILNRTGTRHLLAISGLHIGLIAGLVFFLARISWSLIGLSVFAPATRFASIAATIAAFIYAMLAGLSIPTQRSLIMVTVIMLAVLVNRRYSFSQIICIALLAVVIVDPFAVMAQGMWLSFIAIIVIGYGMGCRIDNRNLWWRWGRMQYVVAIGLAPVLLLMFKQVSLVGIPANLVAVPWVSLLVVPFVLAGAVLIGAFPTPGGFLLDCAARAIGYLFVFIHWLSNLEMAVWHQAPPSIWILPAGILAIIILLQPKGMPARWIGLLYLIPLIFPLKQRPNEKEYWLSLLDVGEGLSAVIHTRNHTLVYDTGARFSDTFNAGEAALIPYLRNMGVQRINLLVISHGDNDHIGGSTSLLRAYPDTSVLTSVPDEFRNTVVNHCYEGQTWNWDGVEFRVLHPARDWDNLKGNNLSCVLKVSAENGQILLSGDIEKPAEYRMVDDYGPYLTVNALVVPHHGSKTSSTTRFIDAVSPDLALFSTGYRNRYNFPNEDIIDRYESRGIHIYDTARDGAIFVRVEQSGISTSSYRQSHRRFWHTEYKSKY